LPEPKLLLEALCTRSVQIADGFEGKPRGVPLCEALQYRRVVRVVEATGADADCAKGRASGHGGDTP